MKRKTVNNMEEKKYTFTLKDVNTEKVDQRFGISIVLNLTMTLKRS